MALQKITDAQMDAAGVIAAPDILEGAPSAVKAVFDRMVRQVVAAAVNQVVDEVNAHEANVQNPHSATKEQVGLGNADNTADTEKPVSTLQQAALALKANILDVLTRTNTVEFAPTENYHPATKKYVDDTAAGVVLGQIPDGSITQQKLNENVRVAPSAHKSTHAIGGSDALEAGDIGAVDVSDKATAEEATEGTDDSKWMTPAKVKTVINPLRNAGSIFIKGTGYNQPLDNCLPCTGGYYLPSAYPELFNTIEYRNGGRLDTGTYLGAIKDTNETVNCVYVDRVTGNIYVGVHNTSNYATSIKVYSPTGTLIRSTQLINSQYAQVTYIRAVNGKGVVCLLDLQQGFKSLYGTVNAFASTVKNTTYASDFTTSCQIIGVAACATFGAVTTVSGAQTYIFNYSNTTWYRYAVPTSPPLLTADPLGTSMYAVQFNTLYTLTIDGTYTQLGNVNYSISTTTGSPESLYLVNGYLYYINESNKKQIIGVRVADLHVFILYTDPNYNYEKITGVMPVANTLVFYVYTGAVFLKMISKGTPGDYVVTLNTAMSQNSVDAFDIANVTIDEVKTLFVVLQEGPYKQVDGADALKFIVPSITSIPGVTAYIGT